MATSQRQPLLIPAEIYDAMISHCIKASPLACCGILAGIEPLASAIYPLRNAAESPTRYRSDPPDLTRALLDHGSCWGNYSTRSIATRLGLSSPAGPAPAKFRTKLELAAELVRWPVELLRKKCPPLWVVIDREIAYPLTDPAKIKPEIRNRQLLGRVSQSPPDDSRHSCS